MAALPPAAVQLTPLELLEKVDAFYRTSWDHLLAYTTGLCIFIGILAPLAMQLIQWLTFKSRALKNSELLDRRMQDIEKGIDAKVAAAVEKSDKVHEAKIKTLEDALNLQIDFIQSFTFTLQGKGQLPLYPSLALKSFITAVEHLIGAPNERELQVVINLIIGDCLPQMNKSHLHVSAASFDPEKSINDLILKLEKEYPNGRHAISISRMRQELVAAKKRVPSGPQPTP